MDRNKLVDFLVNKTNEENKDAGMYMEWAAGCDNAQVKSVLNEIGKQEIHHQEMLIKLLAELAKNPEGGAANV